MINTTVLFLLLFGQAVSDLPAAPSLEDLPEIPAATDLPSGETVTPSDLPSADSASVAAPKSEVELPDPGSSQAGIESNPADNSEQALPEASAEAAADASVEAGNDSSAEQNQPEAAAEQGADSSDSSPKSEEPGLVLHKNTKMIPPPIRVSKTPLNPLGNFAKMYTANGENNNQPTDLATSSSQPNTGTDLSFPPAGDNSMIVPNYSDDEQMPNDMYDANLAPNQGKGHIMPIDQAEIPAQEAGVLTKFYVREGLLVEKGKPLAQIDDEQAKMSVQVQQAKLSAAEKEASNDVNIRYAKAARNVADAEVKQAKETNARVSGAVPTSEVRRLELSLVQATLQIEQASNQFEISKYQVDVSKAELNAAQLGVARRIVVAPIGGVIVEKYRNEGEWVKPGDSILKVVYLDKLRVKTTFDINKMPPQKIMNQPATVTVPQLPQAKFSGKVIFASPMVQSGGTYEVWIDVNNVVGQDGFWQLQPGMSAMVTIE